MTKPLSIAVTGIAGRMGKALRDAISSQDDLYLGAATEAPGHALVGELVDGVEVVDTLSGALVGVDAIVDFAPPDVTARNAELAAEAGVSFVSGTTALEDRHHKTLEQAAQRIPVLWAPNMSVGVAVLCQLVEQAATILGEDFDPELFEIHHRYKVDAPSGTANRLVEVLKTVRELHAVNGREGTPGARPANEIGVHALRGGDVVGEHTVVFAGLGERVELTHRAHSRQTFAQGALRAARFLQTQKPGIYDMNDVLGLAS